MRLADRRDSSGVYFSLGFLNVYSTYIWPKTDQVYLFLAEKTILRTMVGDDHVSRVLTAVESATPCHDIQCDAVQYSAMRRGGVVHAAGVSYACVRERGEAGQHRSSASITTTREGGAHKKRTLWSATVANSRYRAKKKHRIVKGSKTMCAWTDRNPPAWLRRTLHRISPHWPTMSAQQQPNQPIN